MTGKIGKIIHVRGFAFIIDEDGHERFFHASDLVDVEAWPRLKEGQAVTFEPTTNNIRPGRDKPSGNGLGVQKVRIDL